MIKQYIVKDSYLHNIYLVNAESPKEACSKVFHNTCFIAEDSRLSDFKAKNLKEYLKDAEQFGFSLIG